MAKGLDKKLRQLERQGEKIATKIVNLKKRHARALMNEARKLLGRSPITSRKSTRAARPTKTSAPTAKKNGGETK